MIYILEIISWSMGDTAVLIEYMIEKKNTRSLCLKRG